MADDVKTVGVQWQVDYKSLTEAEKAQQRYITNLKKMNQVHGTIARSSQQVDQAMQRQTQALGLLGEGINQQTQAIQTQTQVLERQNQTITAGVAAIEQTTTANNNATQATRTNTEAQRRQSSAVGKNSSSWGKLAKRLVLYTVGAASVFRVVMKLRREFDEAVETIFKNTEEYKKMKEAQDDLKASALAFLGTEEGFKSYFETVTRGLDRISEALIQLRARLKAAQEYIRELNREAMQDPRFRGGGGPPISQEISDEDRARAMAASQDVYNQEVEESTRRAEEWGDALTDAREKGEDATNKLSDSQKRYQRLLEQLVRAEEQRIEDLIDLYDDYERKLQDIIETTNRALADLATEGARRREDIERDYQRRLEDIERRQQEARARNEEQYRLKLLRIEMRYRERLIRIQEDFDDAMYDAIAKRDATAALLAIRRRQREEGRALRERNNAIELARAEYNSQIRLQRLALERLREEAEIARRRALEDLAVYLARERQDIQTNHDRELEDLDVFLTRRRHDIEQDYDWQVARAEAHYTLDEQLYTEHLENRLAELQDYYEQVVAMNNTYLGQLASADVPIGGLTPGTGMQPDVGLPQQAPNVIVAPTVTVTQPVLPSQDVSVSGRFSHQVSGVIGAAMDGMEGRLGAAITEAVVRTMTEVIG